MGTVYSAFLLVYTVFMIPGGFFIDRVGVRLALAVTAFGSAIFGALTGGAGFAFTTGTQVLASLAIVRGLMGLVTTPLHPASARAVTSWVALPQRSLANGLVTGAALLGIACTYRVFGSLIRTYGWPSAFVITGIVTAALGFGWLVCARDQPEGSSTPMNPPSEPALTARGWAGLMAHRSIVLLTLSYAAVGYFQYLFFYWMQYYFEKVLGLGNTESEYYAALPPLAMAVGMPLGGWLSDKLQPRWGYRWGRAAVPVGGLLLSALFLACGIWTKSPVWIVTWFSLALGAMGASEGPFWSTIVELGGKRGGTAAAIMNTGGNAGGMLAPVVTPWASSLYGWQVGIGLGAVVGVAGALCWIWVMPAKRSADGV
jgi:MFS family permease